MAISFISTQTIAGNGGSDPIPTHAVGDLIVLFAFRDDGTAPGLGSGYTSIATGGLGAFQWRLAYRYATSTSEIFETWSGAVILSANVYRGAAFSIPANFDEDRDTVGSLIYKPTAVGSSGSWVAAFVATENSNNTGAAVAPSGMTFRSGQTNVGRRVGSHDTNGISAGFAGSTVAKGGTNGSWRTVTFELVPHTVGNVAYTEVVDGYSTLLAKDREGAVAYTEAADTLSSLAVQERFINTAYTEAVDGYTTDVENGRVLNIAYTEAADTVSSNLDLLISGDVVYTEQADTVSSNLDVLISGSVSYTEENDTVSGLVDKERVGAVAYTEALDTVSAIADLLISGSATYTEALDTLSAATTIAVAAVVAYTEAVDGYAGILDDGVNVTVSYTEAVDGYVGVLEPGIVGDVSYAEQADTLSAALYRGLSADVAYTEALDGYAATAISGQSASVAYTEVIDGYVGLLEPGNFATVAYTEVADTLSGTMAKGRVAAVTYTEAVDGYSTLLLHGVTSSVTYTEQEDTLSAYSTGNISAEVVYTEAVDGYDVYMPVGRSASVVYTEAADTVTTETTKEQVGNIAYTERPDTLSGLISKEIIARVVYTEAADTLIGASSIAITANVSYIEENDTLRTAPVADPRECCPPRLCDITPSMLVCNYVNLLPSGPLWDRAKRRVIEHYVLCANDPAPPPCPVNPDTCSSVVTHAVYTALKLYDILQNGLWPALRESNPNTAFTTLDDWLLRYRWVDCFYGTCRDPDLGPLTPLEFRANCFTYYCEPDTPEELQTAVKHAIVVALSRLDFGVMSRVEEINWVIAPLGAMLRLSANSSDCPISFEIVPTSEYLPLWNAITCQGQDTGQVQAWFDPNGCYNSGLPSKLWPGLMAAECIARSLMQRNQGIKIKRIAC